MGGNVHAAFAARYASLLSENRELRVALNSVCSFAATPGPWVPPRSVPAVRPTSPASARQTADAQGALREARLRDAKRQREMEEAAAKQKREIEIRVLSHRLAEMQMEAEEASAAHSEREAALHASLAAKADELRSRSRSLMQVERLHDALQKEHEELTSRYAIAHAELVAVRGTDQEQQTRLRQMQDEAFAAGKSAASAVARKCISTLSGHLTLLQRDLEETLAARAVQSAWARRKRVQAEKERDQKQEALVAATRLAELASEAAVITQHLDTAKIRETEQKQDEAIRNLQKERSLNKRLSMQAGLNSKRATVSVRGSNGIAMELGMREALIWLFQQEGVRVLQLPPHSAPH